MLPMANDSQYNYRRLSTNFISAGKERNRTLVDIVVEQSIKTKRAVKKLSDIGYSLSVRASVIKHRVRKVGQLGVAVSQTSHKDETLELILGHGAELKALAFSVDHTGICDEILSIPFDNLETLITNIEQGTLFTEYLGQNFDSICETKVTREFGENEICEPIVFSCPQFPQQQTNFPRIIKLSKVGLKHVFIFLEPTFESSSRFSIKIEFGN
ncbi:hypothetical protein T265_11937 [Opisthorchis viverrini]|uniref:Uncharacterized protein n=1 Tax=Opisthorchis viverrini TaxID=6198 RepID=A0A074Z164_OPIVI|nr:hypothetical protein T265_11937 [Opisthorchis viverrini]KER19207.1 hypothetical protein T265_11937 [Opisthorchis viverrini]